MNRVKMRVVNKGGELAVRAETEAPSGKKIKADGLTEDDALFNLGVALETHNERQNFRQQFPKEVEVDLPQVVEDRIGGQRGNGGES